ncbi:MAG: hypothetical protein ACE5KZ_15800 [Candidatus Scalinduaceae bacterium]
MMNGYSLKTDKYPPMPQVENKLLVRVNKVIAFSHAPHRRVRSLLLILS